MAHLCPTEKDILAAEAVQHWMATWGGSECTSSGVFQHGLPVAFCQACSGRDFCPGLF